MAHYKFDQLVQAFKSELMLWPPHEQSFEVSLTKAKMDSETSSIRLSQAEKDYLHQLYLDARTKI